MSLNEIDIAHLIKERTVATIQSSNFEVLKKVMIDRKPIASIIDEIDSILAAAVKADKSVNKMDATENACKLQVIQDIKNATADANEVTADANLKNELSIKLTQLNSQIAQVSLELSSTEKLLESQNALLASSKTNKHALERGLQEIRIAREHILHRYTTIHSNEPNHTHEHGHPNAPAIQTTQYTPQDAIELSRLAGLEVIQMNHIGQLDAEISVHSASVSNLITKLSHISNDKNQKESELVQVRYQLGTELPNRASSRMVREAERLARKNARAGDDPRLQQLSTENLNKLNGEINLYNNQLDYKRECLLQTVNKSSYAVFSEQLGIKLHNATGLSIKYPEIEALKTLFALLDSYKKLEAQETKLSQVVSSLNTILESEKSQLREAEQNYHQYSQSNPALSAQNTRLGKTNIELQERATAYKNTANGQFIAAGNSTAIAIGGALLVELLFLNPLLYVIPGLFALAAVATLVTALVFKYKEWSSMNQIDKNNAQIELNNQQVINQTHDMETLKNITIPTLKQKIPESEEGLRGAKKELSLHQENMQSQMSKMERVTPVEQSALHLLSSRFAPIAQAIPNPATLAGTTPNLTATACEDDQPTTSHSI